MWKCVKISDCLCFPLFGRYFSIHIKRTVFLKLVLFCHVFIDEWISISRAESKGHGIDGNATIGLRRGRERGKGLIWSSVLMSTSISMKQKNQSGHENKSFETMAYVVICTSTKLFFFWARKITERCGPFVSSFLSIYPPIGIYMAHCLQSDNTMDNDSALTTYLVLHTLHNIFLQQ